MRDTDWLWNFLLSFFAPRIAADIGPLILLIFFGMLVFGFFYVYFFIPETKGLSLEEVDEMYRAHVLPWQSTSWVPSEKHLHHHERKHSDFGADSADGGARNGNVGEVRHEKEKM